MGNVSGQCRDCWWLSDLFTCICVHENGENYGRRVLLDGSCPLFDVDTERAGKKQAVKVPAGLKGTRGTHGEK